MLGVNEQYLLSTETSIFLKIFKIFLFILSDCIPQSSIISIKGSELPSIIGTSGPFNSIIMLSIPVPLKAAIKCSIVDILTPYLFSIVVHKLVSETFEYNACIERSLIFLSISVLIKIIPVFSLPGFKVTLIRFPVCRPIPLKLLGFKIVVCQGWFPDVIDGETRLFIKISLINLFSNLKLIYKFITIVMFTVKQLTIKIIDS